MPVRGVFARQIFNSRGEPTVEVDLVTELGLFRVDVPTALHQSADEALELRDQGEDYHGMAVFKAVANVKDVVGPALVKSRLEVTQQDEIDALLVKIDGSSNKSKLGANAILGVSLAVTKAAAAKRGLPLYQHIADLAGNKELILPVPAFNMINGGVHAGNNLALQEILILPVGASSFAEAMRMGSEIYHHLGEIISKKYGYGAKSVGDEGGYAPNISDGKTALNLIYQAVEEADFVGRVVIAIDAAASRFYKQTLYDLDFKNPQSDKGKWLNSDKLMALYQGYIRDYPIITAIEDPFDQSDKETWIKFMAKNPKLQIIGDDFTKTSLSRTKDAITKKACNALLLKINQIGTLTEAIQAYLLAKANGWDTIVAGRSGDTADSFIADMAVGLGTGVIKAGAPCRSERLSKYNQILRIEEELGDGVKYAGQEYRRSQRSSKAKK